MSETLIRALAGTGFAVLAIALSFRHRLGLGREIGVAAVRAIVQLTAVGAAIALVFELPALASVFVAVMASAAAVTAGSRMRLLPGSTWIALLAIVPPALTATGILLLVGAFELTARAIVPTAGILIGGAMAATILTGRRLLEHLDEGGAEIEARLCLGDPVREALRPAMRGAIRTGLVPCIDQTRSVGLVALPGTFVGLVLAGASAATAASTQLVILLALLAVELTAGLLVARLMCRAVTAPGERVVAPSGVPGRRRAPGRG